MLRGSHSVGCLGRTQFRRHQLGEHEAAARAAWSYGVSRCESPRFVSRRRDL